MRIELQETNARHLLEILLIAYDSYTLDRTLLMKEVINDHHNRKLVNKLNDLDDHLFILSWIILSVATPLQNEYGIPKDMQDAVRGIIEYVNSDTFKRHRDLEAWWEERCASPLVEQASAPLRTSVRKIPVTEARPERERDEPQV